MHLKWIFLRRCPNDQGMENVNDLKEPDKYKSM